MRIVSEEEKKEELTLQWFPFNGFLAHCEDFSILFAADELCKVISTRNVSSVK